MERIFRKRKPVYLVVLFGGQQGDESVRCQKSKANADALAKRLKQDGNKPIVKADTLRS